MKDKRVIAIHLPQFHPFKENDEWWGKGFTDWRNVANAKPRFVGHYQPHIPSDTGFYDLRLPESRELQADLAKEYGIDGFCYYHYWFNGHRLMERPVNEIISSGAPDFPFMLCWANENWSRNWDGGYNKILIKQNYTIDDYVAHMEYLCENVFNDKRYITVGGKPFFCIYKPELLPDIKKCISIWREVAKKYNFDLYLGYMSKSCNNYIDFGFDCCIDFQPHSRPYLKDNLFLQILDFSNSNFGFRIWRKIFSEASSPFNMSFNYRDFANCMKKNLFLKFKVYPSITPSWDNSPRRVGRWFFILKKSCPKEFGRWLKFVLQNFRPYSKEENFIFINAWNEWAEGNHLEPDLKYGLGFLEITKKYIDEYNG